MRISRTNDDLKNLDNAKGKRLVIIYSLKVNHETTLLAFCLERLSNLPKTDVKHFLSNKQMLVNGSCITQFNFSLFKGDLVEITKYSNLINSKKNIVEQVNIDIIYEDKDIIVINKKSGLLSVESDNVKQNTAYKMVEDYIRIKNKLARVFVVHRIDKDTSGVLMFAKSEEIKNLFVKSWNTLVKKREYLAICEGEFDKPKGTIKSYLDDDMNHLMRVTDNKTNTFAITNYKVLDSNKRYSYLDVFIDSGKKNQIRVQLASIGHKIVGDVKYESTVNPFGRLGLHAFKLEIQNPITNKLMSFTAKVPKEFNKMFIPKVNKN